VHDWVCFSEAELTNALSGCSNVSAPGPDHLKWSHLKRVIRVHSCATVILTIADVCLMVGHWPLHFKDSLSVIILKPGKPSYSTPKVFRPIVLLNTLGKLVEKMVSNRLQFDSIKYDVFHPNQVRGVRQRSTKDAGMILTHLVRARWAKGLKTSVVAFDIAQFFPSINHNMLLLVLWKQGCPPLVAKFFESYLVGRSMRYAWNSFVSPLHQADVGVGQGLALSPILSTLFIAPIMKLFEQSVALQGVTLLSYVNDSTIIVQSPNLVDNCTALHVVYEEIFRLFTAFALVLEHNKTELFHFHRLCSHESLVIDLGYAPYTGDTPL